MEIKISLSGNKRVDAHVGQFVIKTDQSKEVGGEGSAPEPYSLFLASIGTCAGIYVVGFCNARKIPTDGIELVQTVDFDPSPPHKLLQVGLEVHVPPSFPEKYHKALARAAASCAVKKAILDPPEFDVRTVVTG